MEEDTNFSKPTNLSTTSSTAESQMYKLTEQINELQVSLIRKDTLIAELKEHILTLETGHRIQNKKRKIETESNDDLMLRISEQESNIQQLTKENADLKNKTAEVKTQAIAEAENINRSATPEIIKMIEEKLNSGFSSITENINQMIESKLNNMTAPSPSKSHSATETNGDIASYSAILRGNGNNGGKAKDLRTIMLETKNEELAEEAERKRRVKNLIMFNKSEVTPEHDKDFIQNLIKELKVGDINVLPHQLRWI